MSTHNLCFLREIRKKYDILVEKNALSNIMVLLIFISVNIMTCYARKGPLCHTWAVNTQIIYAGRSGPSLLSKRINGYCRIYHASSGATIEIYTQPSLLALFLSNVMLCRERINK